MASTDPTIVYRIAKWAYLEDLSGTGARLYGGRWNQEGYPMLYTSQHLSLAVLELLANNVRKLVDDTYGYIGISIPHDTNHSIESAILTSTWRQSPYSEQTIMYGTNWLKSKASLALTVPSAVLAQENNILINPLHSDFSKLAIVEKGRLDLDGRV